VGTDSEVGTGKLFKFSESSSSEFGVCPHISPRP